MTDPSTPVAKQRPRFSKIGNFVRTYDLQEKLMVGKKYMFAAQMRDKGLKTIEKGPIEMELYVYLPQPKIDAKKTFKLGIDPETLYHFKKPDADNFQKLYCDVLNGIAYHDDSQISIIHCEKRYSSNPRAEIFIKKIGES